MHVHLTCAAAGLFSAALFGHTLTPNFLIGITIVFISMHLFFSQGVFEQRSQGDVQWYTAYVPSTYQSCLQVD